MNPKSFIMLIVLLSGVLPLSATAEPDQKIYATFGGYKKTPVMKPVCLGESFSLDYATAGIFNVTFGIKYINLGLVDGNLHLHKLNNASPGVYAYGLSESSVACIKILEYASFELTLDKTTNCLTYEMSPCVPSAERILSIDGQKAKKSNLR